MEVAAQAGPTDGWTWTAVPAPAALKRDASGKPAVSSDVSDAPDSALSQWFETHLRPALETAAHPQTLDDVVHLLMSPTDATRGLGVAVLEKALGTLKDAAKAGAAKVKGAIDAVDGDLVGDAVGVISPRAAHAVSLAQRLKTALTTPAEASPRASAPAPPASAPLSAAQSAPAPPVSSAPGGAAPLALTEEEGKALRDLMAAGYPKEKVLQAIAAQRPEAPVAATPAPAAAVAAPPVEAPSAPAAAATPARGATAKLSAAETKEYLRLKALGKSPAEIEHLIDAQRQFQRRFGLPASETARQSISERNATGRWSEDR